jgi:hypothetical protein
MRIVLDLGDTAADVPAILAAMDGDGLELVGVDGSHVGCRIAGIIRNDSTEDARLILSGLLGRPVEDVLHFAVVALTPGKRLAHDFCGLPDDAIKLHALAVHSLASERPDMELAKLNIGAEACGLAPDLEGT